jgi:hypothetical protein
MKTLMHGDNVRVKSWQGGYATLYTLEGYCGALAAQHRAEGEPEAWAVYNGGALVDSAAFRDQARKRHNAAVIVQDGERVQIGDATYQVAVAPRNAGAFPENCCPIAFTA